MTIRMECHNMPVEDSITTGVTIWILGCLFFGYFEHQLGTFMSGAKIDWLRGYIGRHALDSTCLISDYKKGGILCLALVR